MRSGFVCLVGRPNVGKSTLLNTLLGEKIAIVTNRPQTTRNRIRGIKNTPDAQIIILDTPGIHTGPRLLNRAMTLQAVTAMKEVDVVVHLADSLRSDEEEEKEIIRNLRAVRVPRLLALNKVDAVKDKKKILPLIARYHGLGIYKEIFPLSALTGEGCDALLGAIIPLLPPGERLFPEDMITEETERFLVQEIIREKVIENTYQEIPYAAAVSLDSFEEKEGAPVITIRATIFVEKTSQKGIVIGRGGAMLKRIGTEARRDMEKLLGSRIHLELWVKVRDRWTENSSALREFGYHT